MARPPLLKRRMHCCACPGGPSAVSPPGGPDGSGPFHRFGGFEGRRAIADSVHEARVAGGRTAGRIGSKALEAPTDGAKLKDEVAETSDDKDFDRDTSHS